MKHLLILTALFLSACSDPGAESIKDMGKQEIVNDCQGQGHFKHGILTFSCEQLFVAE